MPRTSDLNEELGQVEYVFSESRLQPRLVFRVSGFRGLGFRVRDLECTMEVTGIRYVGVGFVFYAAPACLHDTS